MQLKPLMDLGWAGAVLLFGMATMMFGIPLTILVEAIMIRQIFFKAGKFWLPFGITLGINLVSGAVGMLLVIPLSLNGVDILSIALTGMPTDYYEIAPRVLNILIWGAILSTLVLSIMIEGVILALIFRKNFSATTIWLTAVGINIVSYIGIGLLGLAAKHDYGFSIPKLITIACVYALCIFLLFSLVNKVKNMRLTRGSGSGLEREGR